LDVARQPVSLKTIRVAQTFGHVADK